MTTLTRSPHGLNPGPERTWLLDAACRGRYVLFDGETFADQMIASHICRRHCPVLAECTIAAGRQRGRWYGVLAGMIAGWRTPPDPGCGTWCE